MQAEFWHQRWRENRIGFHQSMVHPLLQSFLDQYPLPAGARVFVPLCGKTLDIGYLLQRGFQVVGAELSEVAIRQLFDNLSLVPEVVPDGAALRYRAAGIDILVGDIFALEPAQLGAVDLIHDRAALVALPEAMREAYASKLIELGGGAMQCLITFVYEQSAMDGPPFSVPAEEVRRLYADSYAIELLSEEALEGGIRGTVEASECLWRLS